jgi:hypothetical protein
MWFWRTVADGHHPLLSRAGIYKALLARQLEEEAERVSRATDFGYMEEGKLERPMT